MPAFSLIALIRALLVWMLIMAAESAQGAVRRILTSEAFDFAVRQASVLLGVAVIFAITWLTMPWMRIRTTVGALLVGDLWVVLTVAFEVGLGRALGQSWDRILADYNLLEGGMMPLGLLAMALTPWAVLRLQAGRGRDFDGRGTAP